MKKIYSLTMIAALALSFTACSNDDNVGSQYLRENTVKIVKSDVSFSAKASTGAIEFTAPAGATVKLNSTWASAAVDGNKVTVNVLDNPKIEGRSAKLTIKSGEDSASVTIQQQGMSFKYGGDAYYIYNDEAHSLQIAAPSEGAELKIQGLDWATASINREGIKIDLAENKTGTIRSGYIHYEAGPYKDSILVMQGEKKDILNKEFSFVGYDMMRATANTESIDELFTSIPGMLTEEKGVMQFYIPSMDYSLPVAFDESTLSLITLSGLPIGVYKNAYYIYSSIVDTGWYSTLKKYGYAYMMSSNDGKQYLMMVAQATTAKNGVLAFKFENVKSNNWLLESLMVSDDYNADAIGFTAYKKQAVSAQNYVGDLMLMAYPTLICAPDEAGAKKSVEQAKIKYAPKAQNRLERLKAANLLPVKK
jgi:hypothetical protein